MANEQPPTRENPFETTAFAAELGSEAPQIDLHNLRVHEAIDELDRAVNHEFMVGSPALRIVHGRGDGKLRRAVHDYLREQTELVAFFRDANAPAQMGGVTIAVLHQRS